MADQVLEVFACRSCQSADLKEVMDLGEQYLSDFPASREEGEASGRKAPLKLVICRTCWLLQLKHTTPPDWLYRHFWYRSGITKTMRDALAEVAQTAEFGVKLAPGDAVCDIGSNDGTLLRSYRTPGLVRVGFEPALNLLEEGQQGGNVVIPDYFAAHPKWHGQFKAVTALAMFYDLDNPCGFLRDVRHVLHPDGVFVIQMNYLLTMLRDCAFDNIGHEHLTYYSLTSLLPLLDRCDMHAYDAELNDLNGGSVRVWCRPGRSRNVATSVEELLQYERMMNLASAEPYKQFADRVADNGLKVRAMLRQNDPEKTYVCGASTRGSTLLQTWGIDSNLIAGAGERDPRKFGKVTSGTWLPIVSEEEARVKADAMLVLPWAFANEIVERETPFLQRGGKLIFPLPRPKEVKMAETAYA